MKNLSIASVIEKNRISSENALAFALDIDVIDPNTLIKVDTIRLVNYVTNLIVEGNEYVAFPFNLDFQGEAGEVQTLTLSVQDQAGIIMPFLQSYKGAVGSAVKAQLITVHPDDSTATIDFVELFSIQSSSVSGYAVSFELGAENPLSRSCPSRTQMRDRCVHRYKSYECGYSGAMESCSLKLGGDNGCEAHNNANRFGGFPSLTVAKL